MIEKIKSAWVTFKYALRFNRWPVQTEEQKIEEARKRLIELLYPDRKENEQ